MTQHATARPTVRSFLDAARGWRHAALHLTAVSLIAVALLPGSADAQFGSLKKLKNAVRPDSATRAASKTRDSVAAASGVTGADTAGTGRSRFARAASAAKRASTKFEAVTGVSVTDAALVASGVGAPNVIAKRMGVSPTGAAAKAVSGAVARRTATADARERSVPTTAAGMAGMLEKMQAAQAAQAGQMSRMSPQAIGGIGLLGLTSADAQAMVAFQQEMMRVALAASTGDVAAQARLEAWQTLTLKHQGEIEALSLAASRGDMAAMRRLEAMQFEMTREWARTTLRTTRAKPAQAAKP